MPVLLEIGNINATVQQTGSLSRFLDQYEHLGLFIEGVLNPDLERHLERRGYTIIPDEFDQPSFYAPIAPHLASPENLKLIETLNTNRIEWGMPALVLDDIPSTDGFRP